jgi:hypothetical protein
LVRKLLRLSCSMKTEVAVNCFLLHADPLIMENGMDLIQMVCTSYETPNTELDEDEEQEAYDFGSFRVLVLRKGSTIMSVGTLRCGMSAAVAFQLTSTIATVCRMAEVRGVKQPPAAMVGADVISGSLGRALRSCHLWPPGRATGELATARGWFR